MPFVLLPFRPTSDTSASRNFVRNFFKAAYEGTQQYTGESLAQELRLTEPLVCPTQPSRSNEIPKTITDVHRHYAVS